jgi:UDP:flavonoid glycosyltransferase YjiC (YdhE family)
VIAEIFAGACAKVALPGLLASMERWRPAIVVRESQEYAAVVAAEKLGVPHARVAITARNAEAHVLSLAAPAVDALGVGLGLSPDPAGDRIRHEATLSMFPASFELPGSSRTLRFRAPRKSAGPLPDWWGAQTGPFVYATLGTVTGNMENRRSAYRVMLDALSGLPIRVLLTIGADLPLEALGDVAANVHVERFISQDDVLPHAAAVVCHGGSGTVLGTLAAGVPMVVAPLFADQPFNAERVAVTGAGLAVASPASPTEIRAALSRVLDEGSFEAAARRMAEEIAALPLVDEAGLELEKLAAVASARSSSSPDGTREE